ncbi:MAG: branched-chain amino acid ABC transporter permease [Armatimonadota bacterium]|nr:branched-chain amino acid ABC transporter permease [Armatimonadota bacterium]
MRPEILLQALVNGILMGGVYSLVSIGLTLIFGVVRIVNFAHGEFLMVGMYITYWLWALTRMDPIVTALVSMPILAVMGYFFYRALVRRVLGAPDLSQIFLTVGVSLVLQNFALLIFTANYRSVTVAYATQAFRVGPVSFSVARLIAFAVAVFLSLLVGLFLGRTDIGRAMRAVAQDRDAAMLLGIDPHRVYALAVALGAALAGAGGSVIMPYFYVFPTVGASFVLIAFVVVIMGGLGNVTGAFLGGIIMGIAESLGILFVGADAGVIVAFIILILVLVLRPQGLLAVRRG